MTSNEILKAAMLDILFDNRNKQYGAYTLRKFYNNRLGISLAIAMSSVLLVFLFIRPGNSIAIIGKQNPDVVIRDLILPPEKKIEIEKPATTTSTAAATQKKFTDNIAIVDNEKIILKALDVTDFNDVHNAGINTYGTPDGPKVPQGNNFLGVVGDKPVVPEIKSEPPVFRDPEFPGGIKAWLAFLNKNIRVPEDLEAGEKKTVLIKFEVAVDGSVTAFKVVQTAGGMYDNEVIRVLRKMPKWKPAIQNNLPVARAFTQPVTFMGVEE